MKRLLSAMVLVLSGVLLAQSGPVVETFAPQINAQVRITGCVRDTQSRVVCAVVFESKAQTNQSVTVLQNTVRALAPDGTVYRGRFSAEGGTADDTKAVFSLPTGMRVNASLIFPDVPPSVTLFAQVAFGGLEFRGIPVAQGRETPTQAARPAPTSRLPFDSWEDFEARLSVGPTSAIYLARDGTVWAWGDNRSGQLGQGKTSEVELKPVVVQALKGKDIVAVSMGSNHALALSRDGTVYAWGANDRGQVGTTPNPLLPYPVRGLKDVVAIRAGNETSYALRRDGTLWAWGSGKWGHLGVGDFSDRANPTQVQGLSGIKALPQGFFGDGVAGVLKEDGTVWVWGNNTHGLLGTGKDCLHWETWHGWDWDDGQPSPVQVETLKDVVQLAVGGHHFVALLKTGEVVAWGLSHRGQAGAFHERCVPITKVPDLQGVVRVQAGGIISSALTRDGTLWAWGAHTSWDGKGAFGMLGIGPVRRDWDRPVPPIGMDGVVFWKQWDTTFAVKADGTVWAWGRNDYGQIGNGTRDNQHTPVQVKLPDMP